MKFVKVFVEGQTEEVFINFLSQDYFEPKGLCLTPVTVKTRKLAGEKANKGGTVTYTKFKKQILDLLTDNSFEMLTTMFDLYKLRKDFPGYNQAVFSNPTAKVRFLEEKLKEDIKDIRFEPYVALHEFEALLFSDPSQIGKRFPNLKPKSINELHKIRKGYNPEEINETEEGAPSRRIKKVILSYQKENDGPVIARKIGLEQIRKACPHFNEWMQKLENLLEK
jgi:Domain of unknown function (DUF4276)